MSTILLNYKLKNTTVSNPDGSFPITFSDATVVTGPGLTSFGKYPNALDLGLSGKAALDVSTLDIDRRRFTLRVVFQANGPVTKRANLLESNRLPFALFLVPRNSTEFDLVASVSPVVHGWRAASTRFATGLRPGVWYVADLVYDIDTVALFVDGAIVSVHAFLWGEMEAFTGQNLYVGTWVDGARDHFDGKIAGIEWWAGIPEELHAQVDERRSYPEWFITHKLETLREQLDLGEPLSAIEYKGGLSVLNAYYFQPYQHGALMYHDSLGMAFEMHGAIYERYRTMGRTPPLGYLVSDESPSTNGAGRKSIFSKGAIYWSPATGAVPVLNQLYIDYEALGEARTLGFPTAPEIATFGGMEQEFQGARMYHKFGAPTAHEVHGAILEKFLASGGIAQWGFPITNETDVLRGDTDAFTIAQPIGKASEFEGCTIFWSSATGAFEVHGEIRKKFMELKGPAGELGFPTSDEQDIFGVAGGRFNTFQNGVLLWYGNSEPVVVARPFRIRIQRINAKENEGPSQGENDMYIYIKVWDGAQLVNNRRHPSSGDWGGRNIIGDDEDLLVPMVFTPNPSKAVTFSVAVWESDTFSDDHLGTWTKELDASNGWGFRENAGTLNSGPFSKINSIIAAVKPVVNLESLTFEQKFWGINQQSTDEISYQTYASAFSDVDSETEWWGVIDWLDRAFYELVIKEIAKDGNCFGLSLEAIYALKDRSIFSMPLNEIKSWCVIEPEANLRHCYQAGADPLWWVVAQITAGNTNDPVKVFNASRAEFIRGNHPVICLTQRFDFTGAPHTVLPVDWDSNSTPWRILICDPNFPDEVKTLTVDPDNNTFEYLGARTYIGGKSGGRFHYIPYSVLSSTQRSPLWDAIMLIIEGTIVLLSSDAQTASLTDGEGRDIDALGDRARELQQNGESLNGFFVPFKGYAHSTMEGAWPVAERPIRQHGKGTVAGEILLRQRVPGRNNVVGPAGVDVTGLAHLPLEALTATRSFRTIRDALFGGRRPSGVNASRTLYHLAQDSKAMSNLSSKAQEIVRRAASSVLSGDFRHSVVGLRPGSLDYIVKHRLTQFRLESSLAQSELVQLAIDRLGTSKNAIEVKPTRDKIMRLEIANQLGVAGDRVSISVEQIAATNTAPLQLNIKPGIGGLEVLTGGERTDARVVVNAVINGSEIRRFFQLPLEGGMRLKLSNVLSQNILSVSRIDKLLGPGRDVKIITGSV